MDEVDRVLELLYDRREGFWPLAELAQTLRIDHVKVDRLLELVRGRRHSLEIAPDRGVRLTEPFALDAHLIERGLDTRRVGRHAICFDEVDSTNDVAFDSARQMDADGLVVLAESMRAGRGRFGKSWLSSPRSNILLSLLLLDDGEHLPPDAITIAAGLATAEAIEIPGAPRAELKWPNDVLLDGRKAAGVLVEMRQVEGRRATVVGIGVNANDSPADADVDSPATNLATEVGHPVERIELVRELLRRLDEWVCRIAAGRLDLLHDSWLGRCGMINQRVEILCGAARYVGRAVDVSPLEGLVLECDDGRCVRLPAAKSTIVK